MSSTMIQPGEDVEAFHFGPADKTLMGIYHRPVPAAGRTCAVVLCPPIEQEYIRCHRAYRQLAVRLARVGFPVLRFDYFGTGDSAGDVAPSGLAQWTADAAAAIETAKDRSRMKQVVIVGLRLGATLAVQVSSQRSDVAGLVLWEPIVNGRAYVEELMAWHQQKIWYFLSDVQSNVPSSEPTELLGLSLNGTMLPDLRAIDLLAAHPVGQKVLLIESSSMEIVQQFRATLDKTGIALEYQQVDGPRVWSDDPDKALVPQAVLQAIVTWVSGAVA